MRNLKFLLFAIFAVMSLQSNAAAITNLKITSFDADKEIQLSFNITGNGSVKITMWNDQKDQVMENRFESVEVFKERISLKTLKRGIYTLELEDELMITKYPIIVGANSISLNASGQHKVYKALLSFDEDDKFMNVNWLMYDFCDAEIQVINKSGDPIFRQSYKNILNFHKRVRLHQLGKGDYKLVVKNDRSSYEKDFEIR